MASLQPSRLRTFKMSFIIVQLLVYDSIKIPFFYVKELTFFGHLVSHRGLAPLKSKINAIVHAPKTTNIIDLRSFLGLVGYYTKFIPLC